MVHAARASAARATAPPSTRHFLIGHTAIRIARNSPENNTLNFSNRSKIACLAAHFAAHNSSIPTQESVVLRSHPYFPQFLIATCPRLEIELTPSQQTRKYFLIASFSALSAPAPRRNNPVRIFLTATDQTEKIANHMKRNEKRFSNRNTERPLCKLCNRPARRGKIADGDSDAAGNYCERLEHQDGAASGGLTVCGVGRYNHCFGREQNARRRSAWSCCRALARRPMPCGVRVPPHHSPARHSLMQRETRAGNSRPEFRSRK